MPSTQIDVQMPAADPHDDNDSTRSEDWVSDRSSSPPPSPSPAHQSSAPVDDPPSPLSGPAGQDSAPEDSVASTEAVVAALEGGRGRKSKPSSNVAAAPSGAKPKSSKSAPRPSSPSPPPPPARPPLQTIRLEIKLGGPEDYEVNVSELAKFEGLRPATPVPEAKRDTSDESEGDDEGENEGENKQQGKGKRRKKKRHIPSEYYDISDPFIDDSELAQDERKFFAQTKQKGFYVSSGQVALVNKPSTAKKPKSKKINIMAPSASVSAALSTATIRLPDLANVAGPSSAPASHVRAKNEDSSRDIHFTLLSDGEDNGKLKRKISEAQSISSVTEGSAKKRRKVVEIHPFTPELEQAIEVLKEGIAKENWDVKGKFPPGIKPLLAQVALKAIITGEYDDNFFNLMPRLFPYNKFTMTKLIKRTIWRDHTNLLLDRQNALLEELKVVAEEGFPKAKEEYEKSVVLWERRQDRAKTDGGAEGANQSHEGSPDASDHQVTPSIGPASLEHRPSMDDGEPEDGATNGKGGKDSHPPAQRYRLTDQIKAIIWQLVCLSNECCRIENEKNTLEGSNQIVSDQGVRKTLYQKIVAAFPDGWLSSGQISREVSVMKKKYEKEVMEIE